MKSKTQHFTPERIRMRETFWNPLRAALRSHLKDYGAQYRMERATGLGSALLHQYACPVCEHDVEPSFSIGMTIALYLQQKKWEAAAITITHRQPSSEYHPVGCLRLLNTLDKGKLSISTY